MITFTMIFPLFSQRDETFFRNPGVDLTGIWFSSTFHSSKLRDLNPDAVGGVFALEFNKDYLLGVENMDWNTQNPTFGDVGIKAKSLYVGYTHNGYKFIHPTVGFSIGRAKLDSDDHVTIKTTTSLASVGAEFNIFRWFRLGGEVGYRNVVSPENTWVEETDFSGPYVAVRLKFGWSWD